MLEGCTSGGRQAKVGASEPAGLAIDARPVRSAASAVRLGGGRAPRSSTAIAASHSGGGIGRPIASPRTRILTSGVVAFPRGIRSAALFGGIDCGRAIDAEGNPLRNSVAYKNAWHIPGGICGRTASPTITYVRHGGKLAAMTENSALWTVFNKNTSNNQPMALTAGPGGYDDSARRA